MPPVRSPDQNRLTTGLQALEKTFLRKDINMAFRRFAWNLYSGSSENQDLPYDCYFQVYSCQRHPEREHHSFAGRLMDPLVGNGIGNLDGDNVVVDFHYSLSGSPQERRLSMSQ